jgi:hypothetical protein
MTASTGSHLRLTRGGLLSTGIKAKILPITLKTATSSPKGNSSTAAVLARQWARNSARFMI